MVQKSSRDYVPTANSGNNVTMADVIGNKTDADSSGGDSIYAQTKETMARLALPSQDGAANNNVGDVIGNKTDTAGGTSIFSNIGKVQADLIIPSQDAADNNTIAEVVGNKADTDAGTSLVSYAKRIEANIVHGLMLNNTSSTGTLAYLDAGGEQTVVEITPASGEEIVGIWLDLVNITQNGTITIYSKIDGNTYREVDSYSFTVATDPDGFYVDINFGISSDFKVTYEEDVDEGDDRNIPFRVIRRKFTIT